MRKTINFLSIVCISICFIFSSCMCKNTDDFKGNETSIDFSNLTYVVFGDSITYGADYSKGYSQMETPYNEAIEDILRLKDSINMGVSGATFTRNNLGLACISDIIVESNLEEVDIISVMGGVNDFNRNLLLGTINDSGVNTIYGALHTTMKFLKDNYPDSYIFYMTPYKEDYSGILWSDINSNGYNLEDVSSAIKEVALIYDIDVLDLFQFGEFELVMNNPDCDGIHPNQDFILEKTAPQIAKFIMENYSDFKN